jgi:hypothetical protein
MNLMPRFEAYAAAFEATLVDDDWTRLQQYFTADAVYLPGDGSEAVGRDRVLETLRNGVNGLDRRFDTRVGELSSAEQSNDVVTIQWKMTLSKQGLPDLTISGREHATFTGDTISRLEDVLDPGTGEAVAGYMAKHGARLN